MIMIKLLKPLSFLPALCLMYMIFTFSAQDGTTSSQLSYKVSYKLVEVGGEILGADFEPWEIDSLAVRFHGVIRKIAHMTEYFALAVAVSFPLYVYGLRGIWLMLVAGFLCVAFACGDEYHQSYVAGRGPSKRDVLIDSFGVFWGIILVRIIGWTGRKTIFRPFGKKKKAHAEVPPYQAPPYPYPPYPNAPYGGNADAQPVSYYPPYGTAADSTDKKKRFSRKNRQTRGGAPDGYGIPNGYGAPGGYGNPGGYGAPDGYGSPNGYGAPGGYGNPGDCGAPSGYGNSGGYGAPDAYDNPGGYYAPTQPPYRRPERESSDRLSEDLSLKKLMHDLKEQKAERKSHNDSSHS